MAALTGHITAGACRGTGFHLAKNTQNSTITCGRYALRSPNPEHVAYFLGWAVWNFRPTCSKSSPQCSIIINHMRVSLPISSAQPRTRPLMPPNQTALKLHQPDPRDTTYLLVEQSASNMSNGPILADLTVGHGNKTAALTDMGP